MTSRSRWLLAAAYVVLTLGGLLSILPFVWMVVTSLKVRGTEFTFPPQLIPNPITFSAYHRIFEYMPFGRNILNSFIVSTTITLGQLLFSSMAAYGFSRLRFPGKDVAFAIYLTTLMVPFQVTLIPTYVLMHYLGWINSLRALIVPPLFGSAFAVFLLRQFILTVPRELDEAAFIDGASYYRIYRDIVLPNIRPALATIAVFAFVAFWNDFMWPVIVLNSPSEMTVTVALGTLTQSYFGTDWPALMAGTLIAMLPMVILYVAAQRYFVQGITLTGLKG